MRLWCGEDFWFFFSWAFVFETCRRNERVKRNIVLLLLTKQYVETIRVVGLFRSHLLDPVDPLWDFDGRKHRDWLCRERIRLLHRTGPSWASPVKNGVMRCCFFITSFFFFVRPWSGGVMTRTNTCRRSMFLTDAYYLAITDLNVGLLLW